jgi:hypothetical protein
MTNPFKPVPKVEVVSGVAAAEREIDAYLTRLCQDGPAPETHLPFTLDKQAAIAAYTKWIKGLSLAPGALKRTADLGRLEPIYVPFWSAVAMGAVGYSGQRGEQHKETEYYTDASGESKSREVSKTVWQPAAGHLGLSFYDLFECASAGLPAAHVNVLAPKDSASLEPYAGGAGDGTVQPCTVDAREAFTRMRAVIQTAVETKVKEDIGGKEQKITRVETLLSGLSMKLFLVPAYQGTYRFRGKEYKVLINAHTGQVTGTYPVSAGKIILIVLLVLALIGAIGAAVYLFLIKPHAHRGEAPQPRPAVVRASDRPVSHPVRSYAAFRACSATGPGLGRGL